MSVKYIIADKYIVCTKVVGAVVVAYAVYKLFKRCFCYNDEYFQHIKWKGGETERRVLVLGLVNAGKTRLVQCFQPGVRPDVPLPRPRPTLGFSVTSIGMGGVDYHFFQGSHRCTWNTMADVIVWVVDSVDRDSMASSCAALHSWLSRYDNISITQSKDGNEETLYGIPVIIVASKQDLEPIASPGDVLEAMHVDKLRPRHRVYIVGTEAPDSGSRKGLWRLYELITYAEKKRFFEREINNK